MSQTSQPTFELAVDSASLGAGLQAFRRVGLRRLAGRQEHGPGRLVLSKSNLHRYETGELTPPLTYAKHLDDLYEGAGWVELSIINLWRPKWNPWQMDHGTASTYHAWRWPAEFHGLVWIKLKPHPDHADTLHHIALEWGPWARAVEQHVSAAGLILITGKAIDPDGISKTCNLTCDPPLFALFGAGETLDGEQILDIRRGWKLANPAAEFADPDEGSSDDSRGM